MERGETSNSKTSKICKPRPLSDYPAKYPTYSSLTKKSFRNAVNLHSEEKAPCKNTWYRDLKSSHIRNKHLLDHPCKEPECCSEIFNMMQDRIKLKKLQRYNLTRPVRTRTLYPVMEEEEETCIPLPEEGEKIVCFPECYLPPESSSEEEDSDGEYEYCRSGSVSECSGCSTLGGGTRRKMHEVIRKDWRELLHMSALKLCMGAVSEEINKQKGGETFQLKLNRR